MKQSTQELVTLYQSSLFAAALMYVKMRRTQKTLFRIPLSSTT